MAGGRVSWWVVGALGVGAVLLVLMNWPGAVDSRKIWSDSDTGWGVSRSWHDPDLLASIVALVAALASRWLRPWALLALGVVAGCVASMIEDGLLILGGGIAAEEVGLWVAVTAVAAAMGVVLLLTVRPRGFRAWPVNRPAAALVLAGLLLFVLSALIQDENGIAFLDVAKLVLLEPIAILALAWLALAAPQPSTRLWLRATVLTNVAIGIVAVVPTVTVIDATPVFLTTLAGSLLVIAGIAMPTLRQAQPADAAPPKDATVSRWFEQHGWVTAVGLGIGALMLLLVNEAGLDAELRLWYNSSFGTPDLQRHQADGTLAASLVALLGAALAWRRGRLGAYAVGAAAGAAALFATAGVVILGGRISYEDTVYVWSISLFFAGLILALVFAGLDLRTLKYRRPDRATSAVLAAGFILLLVDQLLSDEYGPSAVTYTRGLSLLLPIVAAALVLISTTTGDRTLVGAAASYQLLFVVAALYPMAVDQAPIYFRTALVGHLVLLAALVLGIRRLRRADHGATA